MCGREGGPGEGQQVGPDQHREVEFAIVESGVGEHREATAVEAAVAYQDELAREGLRSAFDPDGWKRLLDGLESGPEVGEWTDLPFEGELHPGDGKGVKAGSGHLDEPA